MSECVRGRCGPRSVALGTESSTVSNNEALQQARQYHRLRQYPLAEGLYRHVLRTEPRHAGAHDGLGRLALETRRPDLAIELLAVAAHEDPQNGGTLAFLGMALATVGRLEEAEAQFRRALAVSPDLPEAHINLAGTLERQGRYQEALPFARRGAELSPHHPRVHCNLGIVLYHLGQIDESIAALRRAVALDPSLAKAHWSLSQSLLVGGHFDTGWDEYEWRTAEHRLPEHLSRAPRWNGSSLAGKSIFVHGEQGVGDEIMFASCLPEIVASAKHTTVACRDRLVPLFRRAFPEATIVALPSPGKAEMLDRQQSDWQTPIGSLPRWLRRTWASFPRQSAYLCPDAEMVSEWRDRLSRLGPGFKLGISWRAGGVAREQQRRSTDLHNWQELFKIPGIQFVNLQYGDCARELQTVREHYGVTIHHWPEVDPLNNLDRSAAQIAALDLVISVGNTTVHMAGALGIPTWAIVPRVPGWRWLVAGNKLPWYSCTELFRQTRDNHWSEVFTVVANRLRERVGHPQRTAQSDRDSAARPACESFEMLQTRHCHGELPAAEAGYRALLRHEPQHVEALHHLGVLCCQTGRAAESLVWLDRALAIDDSLALIHFHRAAALEELGRQREAIGALQMAVALNPSFAEAYIRLTGMLEAEGRFVDALPMSTRAVKYAPHDKQARYGHGTVLFHLGKADEAIEHLDAAAEIDAQFPYAHWNGAMARLQLGRFGEGWDKYEWRAAAGVACLDRCESPVWTGEPLAGRTLAVLAEQGVGDEVMFASLYPDMIEQAAHCVITCSPRLERLLSRSFPQATVCPFPRGEGHTFVAPRPIDFHIHAGSAPRYLRRDLASFPQRESYLVPDAAQVTQWRERFRALGTGLKVGISWRAGGLGKEQLRRTATLDAWQNLLRIDGAQFINLQYGNCAEELAEARKTLGVTIHDFPDADPLGDLDAVAAQMAALDLVISVGNTTVHLAGALGVPALTVLPQVPGWRWMLAGDRMPWYTSVELIRQQKAGEWGPTFRTVESRLRDRIGAGSAKVQALAMPASGTKPASRKEVARVEREFQEAGRLHDARDFAPAEERYRRLLAQVPEHTAARHRLAILLLQTERPTEAADHLRYVLALEPDNYLFHHHMATALVNLERPEEAISQLKQSIAAEPNFSESQLNLGGLLERLGRIDEALPVCQRAYDLAPKSAKATYNLANVLFHLGRAEEALPYYRRACELEPEYAKAQWNTGMALLQLGHFDEGWTKYEWREKAGEVILDRCPRPPWDGSSLSGKNVLVLAEQGIGDEVMFASCFPDVIAQAKHCVVGCHPRLAKLFARSFPAATIHGFLRSDGNKWVPPVPIDVYTHMGSLPRAFRPTWESFPQRKSYLIPDADKVGAWRARFAALGPELKVGISWRAGGVAKEQLRRATQFELWRPLLETKGVRFINLQYGDCQAEIEQARSVWGIEVHNWTDADPLGELDNVAAQIAALDLVIAVGNTSVHMAGALGVPAWAILPQVPGWRWMLKTDRIPWYSCVELLRQTEIGGWPELFQRLTTKLESFVADQRGPARGTSTVQGAEIEATESSDKVRAKRPRLVAENPGEADRQLARGVSLRESGRIREAAHALERVLELRPKDAVACYQLGCILRTEGRRADAVTMLSRAVQADGEMLAAWNELANVQLELGRWSDAATSLEQALVLAPEDVSLLNCLGAALQQCGRTAEAIDYLKAATQLAPRSAEVWNNLGCAQQGLDHDEEAVKSFRRATDLAPRLPEPYLGCGTSLRKLGRRDEALRAYRAAAEMHPDLVAAQLDIASTLQELGKHDEAIDYYQRALKVNPRQWTAQLGLGNAYDEVGKTREALAAYDAALAIEARQPELHYNRANLLRKAERFEEAAAGYRQALALRPDYTKAHTNLGKTLRSLCRPDDAVQHYREALRTGVDPVSGEMNLAIALLESGQLDEALAAYDRALELQPGHTQAQVSRAMIHLMAGRFETGWRQYDQRWLSLSAAQQPKARLDRPMWDGASLKGRAIFVQSEQGVGDDIMFASCLPDAIGTARHCVVECDSRLVPLFARSFPTATICGTKGIEQLCDVLRDQPVDVQTLAGSLPRYFRPSAESFPDRMSYLVADPHRTAEWRERFASLGAGWKIGIAWSGGADADERRLRSTKLELWNDLLSLPDVSFINLQYGPQRHAAQQIELPVTIHDWDDVDPLVDLDGQAAQIAALDLVISVTNAGVHLAGALGVPTLVLLPYVPSWRWMLERADSLWYPSVRLLRQSQPGDWSRPLAAAVEHLQAFIASAKPRYRLDAASSRPQRAQRSPDSRSRPSPDVRP